MREIRFVRFTALIVAVLIALVIPVSALATVDIKNISIKQTESGKGIVTVKVYNPLPDDKDFALLLTKNNDFLADTSNVFAIYDEYEAKLGANNEIEFVVDIPDIKMNSDGDSGSAKGEYKITFRNGAGEKDEYIFFYASAPEIHSFISNLQTAISQVTVPGDAYQILDDVVCEPNQAEMFSIGADFFIYRNYTTAYGASAGNEVLNWMYDCGKENSITEDNFAEVYTTALAAGIFNHENKKLDGAVLKLKYNGEAMKQELLTEAQAIMQQTYSSIAGFKKDVYNAYGMTCINHATMTDIERVLDIFKNEAGECASEITAIQGLDIGKQYKAYEYIVNQKTIAKVTSITGLKTLLENAYKAATEPAPSGGTSGGGGGGGGGAFGTAGNKTVSDGANAFPPLSVDPMPGTNVFNDLASDHWAAESVQYLKEKGIVNGTNTGAFEPDRLVTREEFTKMLILAFGMKEESVQTTFADVEDSAWYVPYIGSAVKNGIVNGVDETRFGVGQNISRQDMAVMVMRAAKGQNVALNAVKVYTDFVDDAEIADYAKDAVKTLYRAGILNGKGGNLFEPQTGATRAEAAKIIFEVIGGK